MTVTHFYIVRHGQTLLNQLNRAQGWADSPLTLSGMQAAQKLGSDLSHISFQAVYTSDTKRATQTAQTILEQSGQLSIPMYQDSRLREWCLGDMEGEYNTKFIENVSWWLGGMTYAEMNNRLPEVAAEIHSHDTTGTTETFEQIEKRLIDALVSFSTTHPNGSNLLIVTHAFAIKTLLYLFDFKNMDKNTQIANASIIKLLYDGKKFRRE